MQEADVVCSFALTVVAIYSPFQYMNTVQSIAASFLSDLKHGNLPWMMNAVITVVCTIEGNSLVKITSMLCQLHKMLLALLVESLAKLNINKPISIFHNRPMTFYVH